MTLLPLTVRLSGVPATVSAAPSTVFCSPTILSGEIWPGRTWYVRTLVSRPASVFSVATVLASTLPKAESTGAKTVNSPPFSVSTRLTFGFSLPETAATRFFSSGLLDAATATGSFAMPSTEPAPLGTALAYSAQPGPTGPDIAAVLVLALADELSDIDGAAADVFDEAAGAAVS